MGEYVDAYAYLLKEVPPWGYVVLLALLLFLWVFPLWRIIGKAGYPPALSLLAIFPAVGLILLWWLAFARWPIKGDAAVSARSGPPW